MVTPIERFVLADGHRLDRMERCLIFGQDEYPAVVTAGLRIQARIDIATRFGDRVYLQLAVQRVLQDL